MAAASSCQLQNNTVIQTRCYPSCLLCICLWSGLACFCRVSVVVLNVASNYGKVKYHPNKKINKNNVASIYVNSKQLNDPVTLSLKKNFLD